MKFLTCFFFTFSFLILKAQRMDLQLADRPKVLQSVDINHNNFDDLAAFGKAVGDSRIVVLGEQDHGDADAMQAKARLVRYLHEKKGFKILAFESDGFSINDLLNFRNKDWYVDSLKNSVSPYWGQTKAMSGFWQYYSNARVKNALTVTGFDVGLRTHYAKANFLTRFKKAFTNTALTNDTGFLRVAERLLNGDAAASFNAADKQQFLTMTADVLKNTDKKNPSWFLLQTLYYKALTSWTRNAREAGLTQSLKWLLQNTYKNEKVIVWTASFHGVKNIYEVVKNSERNKFYTDAVNKDSVETMIQMLRRDIQTPIYVLSTIATSGRYTPNAWTSLKNPSDTINYSVQNIEDQIATLQHDHYFLDLENLPADHPLQNKQPMIPYLHKISYEAVWPKIYDGLLFIRNMKPLN